MRFGSLFTGIGGLDLGLERAGMQCVWQSEIDPYCCAVLKKHWPEVPNVGDITKVDPSTLPPVDLICGGFPCQPVSVAGRRKAQADARWLWPEFSRIIGALRPRYVLVENVPGLRSASQGTAFGEVLSDLARYGYDAEWTSIPAAAVGAPHLRYRVFIVAYPDTSRRKWGAYKHRQENPTEVFDTLHTLPSAEDVADAALGAEGFVLGQGGGSGQGEAGGASGPIGWHDDWWAVEPAVGRVAHGVPARVDRLRALGNAVVPQVAEWVGRRILDK